MPAFSNWPSIRSVPHTLKSNDAALSVAPLIIHVPAAVFATTLVFPVNVTVFPFPMITSVPVPGVVVAGGSGMTYVRPGSGIVPFLPFALE